jgi:hypothetical protein
VRWLWLLLALGACRDFQDVDLYVVYNGACQNGWADDTMSSDATVDYSAPDGIAVTSWRTDGLFQLGHDNTASCLDRTNPAAFDTSPYDTLSFMFRNSTGAEIQLKTTADTSNYYPTDGIPFTDVCAANSGQWVRCDVPLAKIVPAGNPTIVEIAFDCRKQGTGAINFAEIAFQHQP